MKNKPIRGFDKLTGQIVKKVNATSINCVLIECLSGDVFAIDASELHFGIPVISLQSVDENTLKQIEGK